MATTEFCWDSFPVKELEGVVKDQKNGADHNKRRHDDLPRYNAPTDGNRKPRGPPFNNRNNTGGQQRVSESKHDTHNGNQFGNGNNRGPIGQRKQRTASDSYDSDRPKSGPPKSNNNTNTVSNNGNNNGRSNFRNSNSTSQRDQDHHNNDSKHRSTQASVKSEKESNNEKELRLQIMRMRGHMLYLKDQNAYKDQVIHHKDQVILALRNKLEKLKEGSSVTAEPSISPVEPKKPEDIDKMEADLAAEDHKEEQNGGHQEEEEKKDSVENGEEKPTEDQPTECLPAEEPKTEEPTPVQSEESKQDEDKKEVPENGEEKSSENLQAQEETPKPEGEEVETKPENDQPNISEENPPPSDQCTSSEGEKPQASEEQPVLTENNC